MISNAETHCTPLLTACLMPTMQPSAPSSWYDFKTTQAIITTLIILVSAFEQDPRTLHPEPHERRQSGNLLWVRALHPHTKSQTLTSLRPTLMGANSGGNIADAGWQVRVIETILNNTFQIFDDDQINGHLPCDGVGLLAMVHEYRYMASNGFMHLGATNILIPKRVLFSLVACACTSYSCPVFFDDTCTRHGYFVVEPFFSLLVHTNIAIHFLFGFSRRNNRIIDSYGVDRCGLVVAAGCANVGHMQFRLYKIVQKGNIWSIEWAMIHESCGCFRLEQSCAKRN